MTHHNTLHSSSTHTFIKIGNSAVFCKVFGHVFQVGRDGYSSARRGRRIEARGAGSELPPWGNGRSAFVLCFYFIYIFLLKQKDEASTQSIEEEGEERKNENRKEQEECE